MAELYDKDSKGAVLTGYKPFYIQGPNDLDAIDTKVAYGMIAKVNPYNPLPDAKEPYKTEWKDRNGEDEYTAEMLYKPIEMEVSFYAKAKDVNNTPAAKVLKSWLENFFAKVKNGSFKIYDAYTDIGYGEVRYVSFKETSYKSRKNWASTIFSIKFKVNAPTVHLSLVNGKIQ